MWIRLQSGDSVSFANDTSEECCGVSNSFLGTLPSGHLLIQTTFEDGIRVSIIDPRDGRTVEVSSRPIPSPSGRFFAAGGDELPSDEPVSIWRLDTASNWVQEYAASQGVRGDVWMPSELHWLDDTTLHYERDAPDTSGADITLVRRDGRWQQKRP